MSEWRVGDWTNCNILTPSSFVFSSTSFSFCWAAQSRVLRAHSSLLGVCSLYSMLSPTHWLQLTQLPVAPGYIIVWHPPASCGRHICTQFNTFTVNVIPWYLRPDAPVIYTGTFLIWQLGRGLICYIIFYSLAVWFKVIFTVVMFVFPYNVVFKRLSHFLYSGSLAQGQ